MAKPLRKPEILDDRHTFGHGPRRSNIARQISKQKKERRRERRVAQKRLTYEEILAEQTCVCCPIDGVRCCDRYESLAKDSSDR